MDTASVIGSMFATFENQLVNPVTDGLWGIIKPIIILALVIAVIGILFSSGMQRGQKIGTVIAVIAIAFSLQFIPPLIYSLVGDVGSVTSGAATTVTDAASNATTVAPGLTN